ncbi:sensor histidine kinase [Microbacterium sp. 22179]|uniref:sensor histidine kinase n=1 Tax=Microbacterium sp. 22179 TaxID=3453886 RepID=UPI003F85D4B3
MTRREGLRAFDTAHPLVWDAALTILIALACTSASAGLSPAGAPFLFAACGAVAFRRRAPFAALVVATAALTIGGVASALIGEPSPWGYLAIWVLLYHVGLRRSGALAASAALIGILALVAFAGAASPGMLALGERGAAMLPVVAMSAATLLAGRQLRSTREAQQRRRADVAREAAAEERSRISREMHDLIGHDLSVIASLAAGGQNVLRSSPNEAERAFAAIGQVSRASVSQLRQVLRLLRSGDSDAPAPLSPQPDLSRLSALIDTVRSAGLQIDDERRGDLHRLPRAHQLAVYRIIQEALTNSLRHGGEGTAVRVRVVVSAQEVVVSIADRGAVPGAGQPAVSTDGHGLVGMRERVDALGGVFHAGATAAGWLVRAVIPNEGGEFDESTSR